MARAYRAGAAGAGTQVPIPGDGLFDGLGAGVRGRDHYRVR